MSERAAAGLAKAFARLRTDTRSHNLRLTDVARPPSRAASTRMCGPPAPPGPPLAAPAADSLTLDLGQVSIGPVTQCRW
jgi:hypothetical protein